MIVYKLTSPSGKSYIGISKNSLNVRWSGHLSNWRRWNNGKSRSGACTKLYYAFNKYSPESWRREVLYEGPEAARYEVQYIRDFNTIEEGYNLSTGGESGSAGVVRTDVDKRKKSEARYRYLETPEGKGFTASRTTGKKYKYWKEQGALDRNTPEEIERRSEAAKKAHLDPTKYQNGAKTGPKVGSKQQESQKRAISDALSATWKITYPDGSVHIVDNLKIWCEEVGLKKTNVQPAFSTHGKHRGYKAVKI